MTNTIKNTATLMKERLKWFGQIVIAGVLIALVVGVVFAVANAQGDDNNAKPVKEPSANGIENITVEENKIVAKNYNYTRCIDLLSSKESVRTGGVGIIGIDEFAWSTYGNNSYFSWVNVPDGLSAPREYGCKGARAISSYGIPLEAINIDNSINAYEINIFEFPLKKYEDVERGHYQLLNESVENLYRISLQRLCTNKNDDVSWYLDTFYSSKPEHIKERPKFSFKWNFDENDKKKILDYINLLMNVKFLKDNDNESLFIVPNIENENNSRHALLHTVMIGLQGNEAVLKHPRTGIVKPLINLSKIADKEILNSLGFSKCEIIKISPLGNNTSFIRVKYNNGVIVDYLVTNIKRDEELMKYEEYSKYSGEYVSYIIEFTDISKFEVKNESGEIKIYEFENPEQYIDAFYTKDSHICFEYSDNGKEGKINLENKTIDWEIKKGIENESCENNTLKIRLEGGENIRFFSFLITKNITKEKNETINETIIYGILSPCNLSEFYNLGLKSRDKMDKYVIKTLLNKGISFSSIFKIMLALHYEKIYFDGCEDTKNYTLIFKFSDKFDEKDLDRIKVIITKILPEEEPYGNGKVECVEEEMKCY
ncbi:MAG: hypothetical protein CVT88_07905 [Candidatus Altiarchaeales archaeon HGW-Altiarchaeales-1]|nr:MAG: hypothetical protein CVT88_07905 [Candidatus Altiarchaeales archaeon HGW-Altiarchaeales-1]